MSNSMKAMLAGAALAGLLTGTSAKLQAQTTGPKTRIKRRHQEPL